MKKRILLVVLAFLMLVMSSCTLFDGLTDEESSSSSRTQSASTSGDIKHEHSFTKTVVPTVCNQKGYTRNICACGYEYIDDFINPTSDHTFERGICFTCGEISFADILNLVSTEAMKANVAVEAVYSNKAYAFSVEVGKSNGSGVIIDYSNGEYYFLTNNHVVYHKEFAEKSNQTKYYVTDYSGKQYQATLVLESARADYDLALLKFSSEEKYTVLDLEEGNREIGDMVVSLGQPQGQPNTITVGKITNYGRVTITGSDVTECNVSFDTLHHNAYINNGSSGGALLDKELNVIAVNYAGAIKDDGTSEGSYAIPVEKIYEYFELIGFEYKPFNNGEQSVPQS